MRFFVVEHVKYSVSQIRYSFAFANGGPLKIHPNPMLASNLCIVGLVVMNCASIKVNI